MSLAAVRNGLFTTLTACGPWSAVEISTCCFDPLEHTSGCAVILLPGDSEITPLTFSGGGVTRDYSRTWEIAGTVYVKDTGDPRRVLSRVWQAVDDIYETISKDASLNGSADAAHVARISYNQDQFVEAAGHLWAPVRFTVLATEI